MDSEMVKVRALCCVTPDGRYEVQGWTSADRDTLMNAIFEADIETWKGRWVWITVQVEKPGAYEEVEANATPADMPDDS